MGWVLRVGWGGVGVGGGGGGCGGGLGFCFLDVMDWSDHKIVS